MVARSAAVIVAASGMTPTAAAAEAEPATATKLAAAGAVREICIRPKSG